ncbi:hypothetical protein JAAARDRAFT_162648 [Jaapia argillacea MUCL 33604]|uniref:N-acetyltransferase domain-containing protein n=1 Tax=Jaapia argillacea MUCL 33604 TaxID=933084 RepID=A0A067PMH1_9AGAM|nr:hypothetical protein JAAARDRAFT_162648 [Jaapia argillacea MUCL 33604]
MAAACRFDFDQNFCFPIHELENERLRLTPFVPATHAAPFIEATQTHPDLYDHLPFGPFDSVTGFMRGLFESRIQPGLGEVLFAVFDKTSKTSNEINGALAGIIGLLNTSPEHLSTEIGFIIIIPSFHRTHVTTNAVGLLQSYCLELPPAGLGLRRVQWQTSTKNEASIRVAQRMGFKLEGIKRWDRVMPEGRIGNGRALREYDAKIERRGRDTTVLAICWDDWIVEKENVRYQMART